MCISPRIIHIKSASSEEISTILQRGKKELDDIMKKIEPIINDVKYNGDKALLKYIKMYDHVEFKSAEDIIVSEKEIKQAYEKLDPKVLKAIEIAIENATKFHKELMPKEVRVTIGKGIEGRRLVIPLKSAGLYIPAGKYPLPSVAVFATIPAKVAGVSQISVCSPPRPDGTLHEATLVAADMSGATTIYKMGGSHAIAAYAYGTETVKRVDVIAGPGGPYVSAAKLLVQKDVKIDLPAGPSEGMVLADESANPLFVAADTISEAEHGPDSAGVLVTPSEMLANKVKDLICEMINQFKEKNKNYIIQNIKKGYTAIVVTDSLSEAIDFVNLYAPEHLVIHTKNPEEALRKLKNFGTACIGPYTPITAGNYMVGPNPILPTGRYARIYSGLSVDHFLKKPTVENLTKEGLETLREHLYNIANYEGFDAHINAVEIRFKSKE